MANENAGYAAKASLTNRTKLIDQDFKVPSSSHGEGRLPQRQNRKTKDLPGSHCQNWKALSGRSLTWPLPKLGQHTEASRKTFTTSPNPNSPKHFSTILCPVANILTRFLPGDDTDTDASMITGKMNWMNGTMFTWSTMKIIHQ